MAVTVVAPVATAVTSPAESTVATAESALAQVTVGDSTTLPSGPITVTDRRVVSPSRRKVGDTGSTETRLVHSGGLSVLGMESSQAASEGGTHSPVAPTRKDSRSRSANAAGTLPDKLVAVTPKSRRLSRPPSSGGNSPTSALTLRISSRSRVRSPASAGIEPVIQFRLRSSVVSWSSWPMDEWSGPRRLLSRRDRLTTLPLSSVSTPAHPESGSSVIQLAPSFQPSPRALSKKAPRTSRSFSGRITFTPIDAVNES